MMQSLSGNFGLDCSTLRKIFILGPGSLEPTTFLVMCHKKKKEKKKGWVDTISLMISNS